MDKKVGDVVEIEKSVDSTKKDGSGIETIDCDTIINNLYGYPNQITTCTLDMRPEVSLSPSSPKPITSTHPFRMLKLPLPDKPLLIKPSEKQKSALELEYFKNANCVFYDPISSNAKYDYFFFVSDDGIIHRLVFNRLESTVTDYNPVSNPYPFEFHPSYLKETAQRLPVSLQFADEHFAFLSTGTGWLIIYHTDNRKSASRWTSIAYIFLPENCDTFVYHQDTNGLDDLTYGHPFHISDVQITSGKVIDIVLTCVTTHVAPDGYPNIGIELKRSTAHWLKLLIDDAHISRFVHHKIIDINGSVYGITIDADRKGLVIASSRLPVIVYDSQGHQSKDKGIRKINTKIPIPKNYEWDDREDSIVIKFSYKGVICFEDVCVEIGNKELSVAHRWERWLCGELSNEIIPADSSWEFDRNLEKLETVIEITLKKKESKIWNELISTNLNGHKLFQPKQREVDCTDTDNLIISWVECDFVLHAANLKNAKFIMSTEQIPNTPKKFAIGYDDNCVLYGFDSTPYPYKHEYTYEGFIPVYQSIENKKYTFFNQKENNMVIIDNNGKIYAYYREIPNTITYQQVLNASNVQNTGLIRIVDYGKLSGNPEIIGAVATERLVYLFSADSMYVVAV